jgi:hypothetical protein
VRHWIELVEEALDASNASMRKLSEPA